MNRKRKIQGRLMHLICGSRKYVKGTISLFLAIIVTPLLGMTLLLVESIRYQDVIETMIEIEDLSSFATLGNYDQFMKDRFGLLSVDQKNDITTVYNKYFNANSAMYQGDITVSTSSINGDYALCDKEVFERQILAYGEMSCILQVLCEGLDIEDLLKKFNDKLNPDKLNKVMNCANDTSSGLKHYAAIKDAMDDAIKSQKDFNNALTAYNNAYNDFEKSATKYVDALKNSSDSNAEPDYSAEAVTNAWKDLTEDVTDPDYGFLISKSPKRKYLESIGSLNNAIITLSNKISDIYQRISEFEKDIIDLKKHGGDSVTDAGITAVVNLMDQLKPLTDYLTWLGVDDSGVLKAVDFTNLQSEIDKMSMNSFNKSTTQSNIKNSYYITIDSKWGGIGDSLTMRLGELEGRDDGGDPLENIANIFTSLMNVSGLWDAALDNVVAESDMYNKVGSQVTALLVCTTVQGLIDGVDSVVNPSSFWDFIKGVVEILASLVLLIFDIITWVTEFTYNLLHNIFKNGLNLVELGKDITIAGYAAYNFSNRRTYEDLFMPISGYKYYDNIYRATCEATATAANFTGTMNTINSVMEGDSTPNATLFKGAEVEYLLCGMNSELKNQIGAFFNVFMFRFLLNFVASFENPEILSQSEMFVYCPVLLQILYCMGEAAIDTFCLVNGVKEHLLKRDFYLTPSGAMFLGKDLLACGNAKAIADATGQSGKVMQPPAGVEKQGLIYLQADYTEHLFWLLLLGCDRNTTILRMQNLVNLESKSYHAKVDNYDTYDFTKTYTYVHTDVQYSIKPMFSFDSMTGGDGFRGKTIKQSRYYGY